MILLIGGFCCGLMAGAAARSGRLCTMGAVEDAVVARDFRAAKTWALSVAVAVAVTQAIRVAGMIDPGESIHGGSRLDWLGALLGGLVFGFGMAMAGTCSFGLLVRAGGGDLRAVVSAAVVGIAAFAFTAGALAPLRHLVTGVAALDFGPWGGTRFDRLVEHAGGGPVALLATVGLVALLALPAIADSRVHRRRALIVAAVGLGLAVGCGWAVNASAIWQFEPARLESLSFVAPVGRLLLQLMSEPIPFAGFGVASVFGVVIGAWAVAAWKDEVRWEAFDDAREMRRHLAGALLMGLGGVLARGCTVGQGLSAASVLALSAPLTVLGVVVGARIGLTLLLEGRGAYGFGKAR